MQTFLPYADFCESAKVLDNKRLGKQRVETLQILKGSWPNHPASKMWAGHHYQLGIYGIAICDEWIARGYKDTCREKIIEIISGYEDTGIPFFIGDDNFHRSHQSNLMRKLPEHYYKYFNVPDDLPYIWPSKQIRVVR